MKIRQIDLKSLVYH